MEMKCNATFNDQCQLTLPVAKRNNGEIFGYSKDADSKEAEYKIGEEVNLNSDMSLYVISKKVNKLNIDKSDIDDIRDGNTSCEVYNSEKTCEVEVPMFNKLGYKIEGYTKTKGNTSDLIDFNSKIEIDDSIDLYPVYTEYPHYANPTKTHFKIDKSEFLHNMYLDIDSSCSNIASSLVSNLNKLFTSLPFYSYNSKMTLLNPTNYRAFERASGFSNSAGFTNEYEPKNPTVLIQCMNNMNSYITAVHELSHVLDVKHKYLYGKYLDEDQEIVDLRNKYINSNNRPLSDYAFSESGNVIPEFFAELLTFYYFNYIDTSSSIDNYTYQRGNFPDDMKRVSEKYLCIGRNNYDRSKCK